MIAAAGLRAHRLGAAAGFDVSAEASLRISP
jgi:hypothetical protein